MKRGLTVCLDNKSQERFGGSNLGSNSRKAHTARSTNNNKSNNESN